MPAKKSSAKLSAPSDAMLASVLRTTKSSWDELIQSIEACHAPVVQQWQPAKTSPTGTLLRLIRKQRTIAYLIPQEGHFLTALVFGEKATDAVRKSDVPLPIIGALNAARPYAEGRGLRLETHSQDDVLTMLKLIAIKMNS